jgi:enterochelin esterase-like enzyme
MKTNVCNIFCLSVILLGCQVGISAQPPQGSIDLIRNFPSKYVTPRNVEVWIPANYNPHKKYAVIYLQDGQMLFDSTRTWNHESWHADRTLSELQLQKKIRDCIAVGIWNNGIYRASEYFPQKALAFLPGGTNADLWKIMSDTALADNYLRFMVYELKPYIDAHYSTFKNQRNTFVMGSSFGGLIALYAICEYPAIFYGAGCMSTHWTGLFRIDNNPVPGAILSYLGKHIPDPENHKIYFDHGTRTLDSMYGPVQKIVDSMFRHHGYQGKNFLSKTFPGADHSESSWSKRLPVPVSFLLGSGGKR